MKKLYLCLIGCIIAFSLFAQTESNISLFEQISELDYKSSKSDIEKLEIFYDLKNQIEKTKPLNDSAYILDLLKISKYEFEVNGNYRVSINLANNSLNLCKNSKKANLDKLKINAYFNIASAYQQLTLYTKAIAYYDTVIFLCNHNFIDNNYFQLDARYHKTTLYFFLSDYQKAIEESILGMNLSLLQGDSSYYVYFLNRKAQSLYYENNLIAAINDAHLALLVSKKISSNYELSTAYKTIGFIYAEKDKMDSAIYFYKQSIKIRLNTKDYQQITQDYIALGNFYLNSSKKFYSSERCYFQSLLFANRIPSSLDRNLAIAQININLGETFSRQKKFKQAINYFLQSFMYLKINLHNNIKENPVSTQISNIANKDLVIVLMSDKTNLLLEQYKSNHDKSFLYACIQTAIVTDSVVTQIRYEQLGEQSKLYWRDKTRDFYTNALDACYLADNKKLAFYFMEKSRAVLLNDKLNELGAAEHLSAADVAKQENYQIKIVELGQKLSALSDTSKTYQNIQLQLLGTKNNFEQFIKSLEQKYPAYYQYKYADDVPSLKNLQSYLSKNNQNFIHYFLGDTVTYILAITASSTKFIRLSQNYFNKNALSQFLQSCANKEQLMNHYDSFAQLSNLIYKKILQPLQLPKGRIIICSDNIVIPFDALCTDVSGKKFLLNDYSFSYVYSARSLMKQFKNANARGNFIGFAPVSFQHYLGVQDLKNAATALTASAACYKNEKLFVEQKATRSNFFSYASSYSIVSIFSHARADTTDNEPVLFMQDSVIHLSELQLLNNPATRLVLLSACQTNVGKAATGEGVYSLARGFATAGIPSVSATLWKADEQTIYAVSEKFNQYLSEGMNKDEALRKAKLYFMQANADNDKLLPYYWANMIVIGNADAIDLASVKISNLTWIIVATVVFLIVLIFIYTKRKIFKHNRSRYVF